MHTYYICMWYKYILQIHFQITNIFSFNPHSNPVSQAWQKFLQFCRWGGQSRIEPGSLRAGPGHRSANSPPLPAARVESNNLLGASGIHFMYYAYPHLGPQPHFQRKLFLSPSRCFQGMGRKKPEHRDGWAVSFPAAKGRRTVRGFKAVWDTPEQIWIKLPSL